MIHQNAFIRSYFSSLGPPSISHSKDSSLLNPGPQVVVTKLELLEPISHNSMLICTFPEIFSEVPTPLWMCSSLCSPPSLQSQERMASTAITGSPNPRVEVGWHLPHHCYVATSSFQTTQSDRRTGIQTISGNWKQLYKHKVSLL